MNLRVNHNCSLYILNISVKRISLNRLLRLLVLKGVFFIVLLCYALAIAIATYFVLYRRKQSRVLVGFPFVFENESNAMIRINGL